MSARGTPVRWTACAASCSALLPSSSSGRSLNLVLWAFAERWYFPTSCRRVRLHVLGAVFAPRGDAIGSLGTSV